MISSEQLECSPTLKPKMSLPKEHCLNKTRLEAILQNFEKKKDLDVMGQRSFLPDGKRGKMVYITFKEFLFKVECIARGMQALGLKKGQAVGIMSRTRAEWTITDFACSSLGLVSIPIYDSYGPANCKFIVESTHVVCIFAGVESVSFLDQVKQECPFVKYLIIYDGNVVDDRFIQENPKIVYTHTYTQIEQIGSSIVRKKKKASASSPSSSSIPVDVVVPFDSSTPPPLSNGAASLSSSSLDTTYSDFSSSEVNDYIAVEEIPTEWPDPTVKASDLDTIVYTSGSTGKPKGALINHTNIIAGGYSLDARRSLHLEHGVYPAFQDVIVCYLPAAHIFERSIENYCLMEGVQIGYYSGSIPQLTEDLMYIRPTLFPVVPRVLTKIFGGLKKKVANMSGVSRALFNASCWLKEKSIYSSWPSPISSGPASLVLGKVALQFGGRLRICFCGSAPLAPAIGQYLNTVMEGARVLEGYGSTECSGASLAMESGDNQYGSIGNLLCGVEGKLASVPELGYFVHDKPYPRGELLLRGESIFKGYYGDEETSRRSLTSDGWLRTGDVACLLPGDRFRIIDRLKNVFKLQQGEYIYLEDIEGVFSTDALIPYIAIFGDSLMSALVCIVYPDPALLREWADKHPPKGYAEQLKLIASSVFPSSLSSSTTAASTPAPTTPITVPSVSMTPSLTAFEVEAQAVFRFLCGCAETKAYLLQHVNDVLNKAGRKRYEIPQDVFVTTEEPSVENEQMTPTSKIRRDKIKSVYKAQIDAMSAPFKAAV